MNQSKIDPIVLKLHTMHGRNKMTNRYRFIILGVLWVFTVSLLGGCGLMYHLDGSDADEIQQFTEEPSETPVNIEARKLQFARRLAERQRQEAAAAVAAAPASTDPRILTKLEEMNQSIAQLNTEVGQLKQELRDGLQAAQTAAPAVVGTVAVARTIEEPMPADESAERTVARKDLRIKVLSGDARLSSARNLALQLQKLGYIVDRIDLAPKSFPETTVFYAAGLESHGSEMAAQLPGSVKKPLTWKSVYDIIVVSGKVQ
jgi:hypothetical protein